MIDVDATVLHRLRGPRPAVVAAAILFAIAGVGPTLEILPRAVAAATVRSVAGKSPADHIADAKALLDAGTINAEEFAKLKAKALA